MLLLCACGSKPGQNQIFACDRGLCPSGFKCNDEGFCINDFSDGGTDGSIVIPATCKTMDSEQTVIACAGVFGKGQAQSVCPASFQVCAGVLSPVLDAACKNSVALGFKGFVTAIPHYADPSQPFVQGSCTAVAGWLPGMKICGSDPNATSDSTNCNGWPRATICSRSGAFACDAADIKAVSNNNAGFGAMCCR